ncbi:DUF1573 domain-containing protein [Prolixibacteraceae bacterium JC049]|nr:DUF1573 domain-containing protein [Prolixibacteraceae bacterium JC049]
MRLFQHIVFICVIVLASGCGPKKQKQTTTESKEQVTKGKAKFAFDEEIHNFGSLKNNVKVSYTFAFKNVGGQDLLISRVDEGCSCTTVTWPQRAIKAGETEYIEVVLDTHGENGNLYRTVTLFSNATEKQKELIITAFIQ